MSDVLPDEMWSNILEIGIQSKALDYRSLCCLSISCRRLNRLSSGDSLWSNLLLTDFPTSQNGSTSNNEVSSRGNSFSICKNLYRISYEKDMDQKRLTHRRIVLRCEGEIAEHQRRIQDIKHKLAEEMQKYNTASDELHSLCRVRQACVASKVWQPEIIRSRQNAMVQQCQVPVNSRIKAVEMEKSLCQKQMIGSQNALKDLREKLSSAKKQLESAKYRPLQDVNDSDLNRNIVYKKLKRTSNTCYL